MATDHNPYIILDAITFSKMYHAMELAVKMSENAQYQHLSDELNTIRQTVRSKALSFTGSQNVPTSAKKAY
jgi:hypothetical protein